MTLMQPGTRLLPWIEPTLEMRPSPIAGMGAFATQPIPIGATVAVWGGVVYTHAGLLVGMANLDTVAILDDGLYLADPADEPLAEEYAINHSCDSNLWMGDAITLVARRDIAPGEELTADYALWLCEVDWRLDVCQCGSPLCRGKVTADDWRLPELQARYAGHFTPYLNRLISRFSRKE